MEKIRELALQVAVATEEIIKLRGGHPYYAGKVELFIEGLEPVATVGAATFCTCVSQLQDARFEAMWDGKEDTRHMPSLHHLKNRISEACGFAAAWRPVVVNGW